VATQVGIETNPRILNLINLREKLPNEYRWGRDVKPLLSSYFSGNPRGFRKTEKKKKEIKS